MKTITLLLLIAWTLAAHAADFSYQTETLGGIKIGDPVAKVSKLAGKPKSKDKKQKWEADGLYHQQWKYPALGVSVGLSSATSSGKQTVFAIEVAKPGRWSTGRGIKIGSTAAEVEKAYGASISKEESSKDTLVVGSMYGGVIFRIADGRVTSIYLGAAAE